MKQPSLLPPSMPDKIYGAIGILALVVCVAFWLFGEAKKAFADQDYLPQGASANASRSCSFEARRAKVVTVTDSSAATSAALPSGVVRIMCTVDAHMYQALTGVTGPTAGTGDTMLSQYTPEYVLNYGSYFAFLRGASTNGYCFLTECK